jgi:hypothetical protein
MCRAPACRIELTSKTIAAGYCDVFADWNVLRGRCRCSYMLAAIEK